MRAARQTLTALQKTLDRDRIYVKGHAPAGQPGTAPSTVRILTWNIGRGYQPARIAEAIRQINPDIACLQEVDWGNVRTGSLDVLQHLADQCGMLGLYGIEFIELESHRRSARLAGGGATGNAILTRLAPASTFRIELPSALDWEHGETNATLPTSLRWRMRREPRIGRRFGIGVELGLGERRLVVASLHLEDKHGGVANRWRQFGAARDAVDRRGGAGAIRVIAGDFNTFGNRVAQLFVGKAETTGAGMPPGMSETQWWRSKLLPSTGYADRFPPASVDVLGDAAISRQAGLDCDAGRQRRRLSASVNFHRPITGRCGWILKLADAQHRRRSNFVSSVAEVVELHGKIGDGFLD